VNKVSQAPLVLTPVSPFLTFFESPLSSTALNLTGGSGAGAVTYSIEPGSSSVCSLVVTNGVPTITANYFGYCVVRASKVGNVNFADATTTATVRISQPGTQITATVTDSTVPFKAAPGVVNLVTVEGSKAGDILSYSVDPQSKDICSVSGISTTAQVTALGQGTCSVIAINVARASDGTLIASSATVTFTITKAQQVVSVVAATPTVNFATPAATDVITVTGGVVGSVITATVSPSSAAICSVVVSGNKVTMTALQVGDCVINITKAGDAGFEDYTTSITIPVLKAKQAALVLTATPATITYSATTPATSTLTTTGGSGEGVVSYAVDLASASICSVSGNIVTALTGGDCVLTATKAGDVNYADETKSVTVKINKGNQAALLASATPATITYSATTPATSTLTTTGGSGEGVVSYTVTPASTTICSVTGNIVTALTPGNCVVTVTKASDPYFNETTTTVSVTIAKLQPVVVLNAGALTAGVADPARTLTSVVTVPGTSGASNVPVVYTSKTTGICTVTGTQLSFVAVGTCTLSAATSATATLNAATSVDVSITVSKSNQTVLATLPKDTLPATATTDSDDGFQLVATSSASLPVEYVSATPTICTVTATGLVNGLTAGECTVNVSQAGNAIYNPATLTPMTFTITKAPTGPTVDEGDPGSPTSLSSGGLTKMGDMAFQWKKSLGALTVETYGIWIGKITAVSEFTVAGKAYKCTVDFGILKALPSKTAAQKKTAMAAKTFKASKPFCNSTTEAAAFKVLKANFNGLAVKVTVTRFRMYPTTYKPVNAVTKKPITTQIRKVYLTLG
jgi:hypothetical protein